MHSECMAEIAGRVKQMRVAFRHRTEQQGRAAEYTDPGEMRGYFEVLKLICPNPLED